MSDPTVYQHVFTLQGPTVSRQLPVASIVEVIGAARNRLHPSMLLGQLGLSGDGIKRIEAQAQFDGTGATPPPSGLSVADMETIRQTGLHYFFNSQAHATIADAGTLANAVAYGALKRFNSWSWGLNNNPLLEEGYRPGSDKYLTAGDATSGAVRAELLFGVRAITASQLVRLQSRAPKRVTHPEWKPLRVPSPTGQVAARLPSRLSNRGQAQEKTGKSPAKSRHCAKNLNTMYLL